jgi:hypothetical protein
MTYKKREMEEGGRRRRHPKKKKGSPYDIVMKDGSMNGFPDNEMFWDEKANCWHLDLENPVTITKVNKLLLGAKISMAFYIPCDSDFKESGRWNIWSVLAAEGFRCPYDHCEVWIGDKVVVGNIGLDKGAIKAGFVSERRAHGTFDLIEVPFLPRCSPQIVDILAQMCNTHVKYQAHPLHFIPPFKWLLSLKQKDYDSSDTRTWTRGITCSQFVILFLKECQKQGLVFPEQPLIDTIESSTCLPSHILSLVTTPPLNQTIIRRLRVPSEYLTK